MRYEFDCWYKGDGRPMKRFIDADNEDDAMEKFDEKHPGMEYDYPYEA